jgi:hypothetical protein
MAFRHVFAHACELEPDPEKLALLLKYAHRVADRRPAPIEDFIREIAREQQLGLWRTRKAGHQVGSPLNSRIRLAIRPRDKKGRRFFSGGSFRNLIENWRKNEVVSSICGG